MSLDLSSVATQLLANLTSSTFVKLVRKTESYDPITGTETVTSETVTNLVGGSMPISSNLIDGTRIRATDKMIVCDNAIKPLFTDYIRIDSVDYAIVDIIEVNHAGIPQLYKVIARG